PPSCRVTSRGTQERRNFRADCRRVGQSPLCSASAYATAASPARLRVDLQQRRTSMCGIVGYVGKQDALPILIAGLHRLEYRGYDSAGVALVGRNGLHVHKTAGRIRQLEGLLPKRLKGSAGIAHTRWATHGEPTDINAHPHSDCGRHLAVVHNGIIENASLLRAQLEAQGHVFRSDTDTEVLAHLIEAANGVDLDQAVRQALL